MIRTKQNLALALLCVGCSGSDFSANERQAASDGGDDLVEARDKPSITSDDAGVDGSSSGGSSGAASEGGPPDGGSLSEGGSDSSGSDAGFDGCTTGAVRCSGAQPQTCVDGVWLANGSICSEALPICLEGTCVECDPGSHSCATQAQPRTCDTSGTWVLEAVCSDATPLCSAGTCAGACCRFADETVLPCDAAAPWQCTGAQTFTCTDLGNCEVGSSPCSSSVDGLYGGSIIPCE